MKILYSFLLLFVLCFLLSSHVCNAQYTWNRKTDFGGAVRYLAVGFSIGTKGYIVTGDSGSYENDLWEYNQGNDTWTQKARFKGTARYGATGFSLNGKGYVGAGSDGLNKDGSYRMLKDFWEYDPVTDVWTKKADIGGMPRYLATGLSIGNKGYIGLGNNYTSYYNDFWEYDPLTDKWTQKADFAGAPRYAAPGFAIGNKGYVGTGSSNTYFGDFWEYDPASDKWTQKADFAGGGRMGACGFSIGTKGYIGTGITFVGGTTIYKDFWEYNPVSDSWTQKADVGNIPRSLAVAFSIGTKGYISTGANNGVNKELWEYSTLNTLANFSSPLTSFCAGGCTTFTNSSVNGTAYQWYFPGAVIPGSTDSIPGNVCYNNPGQYDVELISINGNSNDTLILYNYITVNAGANAGTISSTPDTVCYNTNAILTTTTNFGNLQWQLSPNGTSFSSITGATSDSYQTGNLTTGKYYRLMAQSGSCGIDSSNTLKISVRPASFAGILTAQRDTVCEGTLTHLSLAGSSGSIQWQQSMDSGIFTDIGGANNVSYSTTLIQTTNFRVVAASGNCTDTSSSLTVVAMPSPAVSFTSSGSGRVIAFNANGTEGINTYSWDFGDNTILNNEVNPVHTYSLPGDTFNVCLTVYNGSNCSFTICKNVSLKVTGIPVVSKENQWVVYPNPVSDYFTINGNAVSKITGIEVYDILGKQLLCISNAPEKENTVKINISAFEKGVYYLEITTDKINFIQPLIKQ